MVQNSLTPDGNTVDQFGFNRRQFVRTVGAVAGASVLPRFASAAETDDVEPRSEKPSSENLAAKLFHSLNDAQKKELCFDWDHKDDRGLLRTHVSNNWHITDRQRLNVGGSFFTKDQQELIEALFFGLYNPEWHDRIRKQLKDDAGGYGKQQTIAMFGQPGTEHFEFVMTGRHLTIRCDGNSTEHMAFGGPIFYGHAAQGFTEKADHPGNVFWPQALKANALFKMLDGKQRGQALVDRAPYESEVGFRSADDIDGIRVTELAADQKEHLKGVLDLLIEPYREVDRREALSCLEARGGLDACRLAFFKNDDAGKSADVGNDGVWDWWRLEGPAFVWNFRGLPHVHVWVNISDDPSVELNAVG
jgi:hypothetical protein